MTTAAFIKIRKLDPGDLAAILDIDHSYHTDYVWQLDLKMEESEVKISFREVRLPRSMHVDYPHSPQGLSGESAGDDSIFVAERENEILGYVKIILGRAPASAWISDLVVLRRLRRQGIGTSLALQAEKWAREQDCQRIIFEMQTKNYPAINLANKLGYEFSGFSDQYYQNLDIALFFARRL